MQTVPPSGTTIGDSGLAHAEAKLDGLAGPGRVTFATDHRPSGLLAGRGQCSRLPCRTSSCLQVLLGQAALPTLSFCGVVLQCKQYPSSFTVISDHIHP